MKIRTGFVSNSSSSSFCIYGIYDKFFELEIPDDCCNSIADILEQIIKDNKLNLTVSVGDPNSSEEVYVGRELRTLQNTPDITFREFCKEIEEDIRVLLTEAKITKKIKFGILEEAWRDG